MRFSDRHGFRAPEPEVTIREDAPANLRYAIVQIARDCDMSPSSIRDVACAVLRREPDPNNWSASNIWNEVRELLRECAWFKVYDIAEALYDRLQRYQSPELEAYKDQLNDFFREEGIGWELTEEGIMFRGGETFTAATAEASKVLADTGRTRAAVEIHEALRDISRRPIPDITGAIQHAIAALECTGRDLLGEPNATLGKLMPQLALPKPLDAAVEKLWGFASDRARHIREGQEIHGAEAELVVSIACAVCSFLSKRAANDRPS